MVQQFHTTSENCSRIVTENYSTSFSSAIRMLHRDLRAPVFNIYGFVRFADEIVDTFHDYDKDGLLAHFKKETYEAIERRISLNPVLNSFQRTVNEYNIDRNLVEAFFHSMEMDLGKKCYDCEGYKEYIYGSAEVVGLMCLYVFCEGNKDLYHKLESSARALGAAFQKVNFLRDANAACQQLGRTYFPWVDFSNFTFCSKRKIEDDISIDFANAYKGLAQLPATARFGVYVAYKYYLSLFNKIKKAKPKSILYSWGC